MRKKSDDLKKKLTDGAPRQRRQLSTASTLLNLAMSGSPHFGYTSGHYYLLVGDSESGKTMLALTAFAEASVNNHFSSYRFVFDNPEDGALMDRARYFGKNASERLEEVRSAHLEDFYYRVDDLLREKKPFIYVLDSMDALKPRADRDKHDENRSAYERGQESTGSYGTAKAKCNSDNLPRVVSGLYESESILIVVSQTRDKIGFGSQFNPKIYSGGKSLRFYATAEIWTATKEKINKRVLGKDREQGMIMQIAVKKNRESGRHPKILARFYHSFGLDDVSSCVDYLIDEKHWKEHKNTLTAPEFDFEGARDDLVARVEQDCLEADLRTIVTRVWRDIEQATIVRRKSKYD